jgi:FAD/FMN-containing dehydrogenase
LLVGSYAPALFNLDLMIYWPDWPTALHRATASQEKVAQGDRLTDNPEARRFLSDLWSELIDATAEFGANYIGIGGPELKFRQGRDPASFELLRAFKRAIDPDCVLSPGAFDLD